MRGSAGRTARSAGARSPASRSTRSSSRSWRSLPATRFTVNAPVVRDRKGEFRDIFEELRNEGFSRIKVDGEQHTLDEPPTLDKKFKHTIEVVVDRLVMKDDLRTRLTQSVETAAALAEGVVAVDLVDGGETMTYSQNFACPEHGVSLAELQPRIFSFNSPHGACPRCTGLGAQQEIDPDLLVPDPTLSIDDGALVPWAVGGSGLLRVGDPGDRRPVRDPHRRALAGALDGAAGLLPERDRRRQGVRAVPKPHGAQAVVHDRLRGDRHLARAALPRDRLQHPARADRGVHVVPALPGLQGRAAQARGAGGDRRRAQHPRVHALLDHARARVPRQPRPDRDRGADRASHRQGDPRAA